MLIRIVILLFVSISVYFPAGAQKSISAEKDSLERLLPTAKEDKRKIHLYYSLLYLYSVENPESGVQYVDPAIALTRKLNWHQADIYSMAGRVYWKIGKMDSARKYHFMALDMLNEKKEPKEFAGIISFIGQDYADEGNFPEALTYFRRAQKIYQAQKDYQELANTSLFLSWVYQQQGNFVESSKANMETLRAYESAGDDYGTAVALSNLAEDHIQLDKNLEAIAYCNRAIELLKKTNDDIVNMAGCYMTISRAYTNLRNYQKALQLTDTAYSYGNKVNDYVVMGTAMQNKGQIFTMLNDHSKAVEVYEAAIGYFRKANASQLKTEAYSNLSLAYVRLNQPESAKRALDSAASYIGQLDSKRTLSLYLNGLQTYDSLMGNWKDAYFNFGKYISIRDSMYNADNTKKLLQNQVQYEFDKKEAEAKAEQEKKDIRQRFIRNSIIAMLGASLIFLVVVYRQRNKISRARKRSDELLLNILPEETAEELKANGSAAARHFNMVTVMFTDFKNFTQASEKLSPTELVEEIHHCYSAFDRIIDKYNLEKIKTIGDSYMCAGGLPVSNETNAEDTVRAAMEICEFMREEKKRREEAGKPFFEIRIGCHTGPVVAGIVGIKKFAYDIWGDTVNIASRMESSGEAGKVNISGSTYDLVKDKFHCIHRGKISAKNKGEIDMYFVEGA